MNASQAVAKYVQDLTNLADPEKALQNVAVVVGKRSDDASAVANVLLARARKSEGVVKELLRVSARWFFAHAGMLSMQPPAEKIQYAKDLGEAEKTLIPLVKKWKENKAKALKDVGAPQAPSGSVGNPNEVARHLVETIIDVGADEALLNAVRELHSLNTQDAKHVDFALQELSKQYNGMMKDVVDTAAQWFHMHANILSDAAIVGKIDPYNLANRDGEQKSLNHLVKMIKRLKSSSVETRVVARYQARQTSKVFR
jgi:hypothetical protein